MGEPSQPHAPETATSALRWWRQGSVIAWAVISAAFVLFLLLGSVQARIWRLGTLHIDSKTITGTWAAEMRNLPDQFPGWLMQSLVAGSLIVFVVGVVIGFRLLLTPDQPESW
jgi:hypothetical protein